MTDLEEWLGGDDVVLARALEVELDWLGRGMLSEALDSLGALAHRGGAGLEEALREVVRDALVRDEDARREALERMLGTPVPRGELVGVVSGVWELVTPLVLEHGGGSELALVPEGVLVALDAVAPWRLLDLEVSVARWNTSELSDEVLETARCLVGSMRLEDALEAACALEERPEE